uniref:Coiled-coil-helix-coiled-coil-helix domain-containing protein 7 n=1 Tax=Amphimedon queenslandica TaxID=400682 RepID=A0A1X7U7V5_AMPQE
MGDRTRWSDPKTNPCLKEANDSYKCMDDNNYNRDACLEYFKMYKDCRKKMNLARREGKPFESIK